MGFKIKAELRQGEGRCVAPFARRDAAANLLQTGAPLAFQPAEGEELAASKWLTGPRDHYQNTI